MFSLEPGRRLRTVTTKLVCINIEANRLGFCPKRNMPGLILNERRRKKLLLDSYLVSKYLLHYFLIFSFHSNNISTTYDLFSPFNLCDLVYYVSCLYLFHDVILRL